MKTYQGYQAVTDEQARHLFFAKYGKQPKKIIRYDFIVLAGPLEDDHEE